MRMDSVLLIPQQTSYPFEANLEEAPGHRLQNNRRTRARESAPSSGKVPAIMAYQEEAVLSNIERPAVNWSSEELVGLADATRAMPVKTPPPRK